jgi:outer membrane protein
MRRALVAASVLATTATAFAARAQQKIGYVDVQRAIQETEEGKSARTRLRSEFEQRKAAIDKKGSDLEKMQQDYDKQATVLSDDAKKKKQEEFQKLLVDARKSANELQEDMQTKEQQAMAGILQRLQQVVAEIAEREQLSFVIDKATLLYGPPAADLTNEVVRRYNDKWGAGESAKNAKATTPAKGPAGKAPPPPPAQASGKK